MNIERFNGWVIICPYCKFKEYISEEDIAFNPTDDVVHVVECKKCSKEFEVYHI